MRVLTVGSMYPPHHLGGYELMWHSSVSALRERGHEVRVLASDLRLDGSDRGLDEGPGVYRELRWYWKDHEFPRLGTRERLALERHNRDVIRAHLGGFRPDVVCWWAMGGMSLALVELVRREGPPAVGIVVDDWMVYGPLVDQWQARFSGLGPLTRAVEAAAKIPTRLELDRAARWVFVSDAVRRRAGESWPEVADCPVAHGGVDPAAFPRAPEREWGGRLVYVGRIDRRKGIATAINALAELPGMVLRIVGGGDEAHLNELRERVAALGLGERVSFERAARDEIAGIYADADAVLFPVIWDEPWGLVPLEAMSVGRPVAATGAGGSGEYLRDGHNCLIFEPREDHRALASALRRLAADPALRVRLREGGFETAARFTEQRFNDAIAREIEAVT